MARKRRQKRRTAASRKKWRPLEALSGRRRELYQVGTVLLTLSLLVGWTVTTARLDAHVRNLVRDRFDPSVAFVDIPDLLTGLARDELRAGIAGIVDHANWTDDRICRRMAEELGRSGWVARVNYVRRSGDARFSISCRYRLPVAMVQRDGEFYLVDDDGVRLPGKYLYDPSWPLIQGAGAPPPEPGVSWSGQDLYAGLKVLRAVRSEPFSRQITAVLVGNYDGRADPLREHIELATDRAGGRIRWGSAPGRELEENTVAQKLAILRENFRRTGRVDANHPVINISTLPDRFSIPG